MKVDLLFKGLGGFLFGFFLFILSISLGICLEPVKMHLIISWVSVVAKARLKEAGNHTNVKAGKFLSFFFSVTS